MCIAIDADTLSRVFKKGNSEHPLFKPVFDWIFHGPGIVVYGGTEYIRQAQSYLGLFVELDKVGKVHVADRKEVDDREEWVKNTLTHADFDDQHLVAILLVTGCILVCTADKRSHKFVSHRKFFPGARRRPRFYGGLADAKCLCNRNIPDRFKPSTKLNRAAKRQLADRGIL